MNPKHDHRRRGSRVWESTSPDGPLLVRKTRPTPGSTFLPTNPMGGDIDSAIHQTRTDVPMEALSGGRGGSERSHEQRCASCGVPQEHCSALTHNYPTLEGMKCQGTILLQERFRRSWALFRGEVALHARMVRGRTISSYMSVTVLSRVFRQGPAPTTAELLLRTSYAWTYRGAVLLMTS